MEREVNLKFMVNRVLHFNEDIEVRLGAEVGTGFMVAKPVEFEGCAEGCYIEPLIRLSSEEARRLMDELWTAGVRPSTGDGSVGQLAAVQAHLQDMRALVFQEQGAIKAGGTA